MFDFLRITFLLAFRHFFSSFQLLFETDPQTEEFFRCFFLFSAKKVLNKEKSLCFAIFAFVWVKFVKKQNFFSIKSQETLEDGTVQVKTVPLSKFLVYGGICETVGQIFYMAVVASDFVQGLPMISSYCVLSVVWSRIFLKEKLSLKHYIAIFATLIGIVILGLAEM